MAFRILALFICLISFGKLQAQSFGNYQVIGNSIGVSSLSETNFKAYMKGKYTLWSNNHQVLVVFPSSDHAKAEEISRLVYNRSHTATRKYWLSVVFQGRSVAPKFCDTDQEILEFVKSKKGSIGIVSKSVDVPENLKITIN